FTNSVRTEATVYYKKVWSIITDYRLYYQQKIAGVSEAFNNNILNARLQRTFKNNEYTVYVAVRDILNQNVGITRNYYGNSYYEENNQRLKRYFMVGFSWDFKNKAPQAKK
ncbi:MAG TPA: hypothetical protein PKK69_04350, partial [Ferruginibacter sp.]|nr:hypothetical protein [Ferruginibacter sp.]